MLTASKMNPDPSDNDSSTHWNMQEQVNLLQQQLQQLQAFNQHLVTMLNSQSNKNMRTGKPDKFTGENARAWIDSIENVFAAEENPVQEESKIQYAVSFLGE